MTSEWSQRSGLTTFTLVPHRGRVIAAKAIACVGVAVATIPLALAIGALGNLVGASIAGIDPVWDLTVTNMLTIVLANVLGLLVGFMLGVLIRSSAGALVAYFVYSFLLPTLSMILAASQDWFRHLQPWVDFQYAAGHPDRRHRHQRTMGPPRNIRNALAGHPAGDRAWARHESGGQVVQPHHGALLRPPPPSHQTPGESMSAQQMFLDPTDQSVGHLLQRGISGPITMLNLLRFRDWADYSDFPRQPHPARSAAGTPMTDT